MLVLITFLAGLLVVCFGILWRRKDYWKQRGVGGPLPGFFFGSLPQIGDVNFHPLPFKLQEWTREFGNVYGIQRGWIPALVVADAAAANRLLVEQFDCFYARDHPPIFGDTEKEAMSHVFFSHGVLPTVHACATTLMDRIREDLKTANERNELDVSKSVNEYSADVIFRMAYGRTDSRGALQKWASATLRVVETSRGWFHNIAWALPWTWRLLKGMKFVTTLLFQFPFIRFIRQVLQELQKRQKANKEAAERGEEPKEPADFIDFFMQSESSDFRPVPEKPGDFDRRHAPIVKEMTLMEVFGQCVLFAFAGFDTVANTLSFVLQFMTVHPNVQERMRTEIHEVFGDRESIDYDQLNELKYAEAVIKETLRLFPLGEVVTSRRCMKPTELAGIPIEAGVDVLIDVMSIHRDPELWGKDANEFRPERWLDDSRPIPANAFFGFGAGLRECVGRRLAYLELKVVLVELLRNFRLVECPRTKDGVDNVIGFLMHPSSVFVRLEGLDRNREGSKQ